MKIREFLDVVPRAFKGTALAVSTCCFVAGGVVLIRYLSGVGVLDVSRGLSFGLLVTVCASIWILCLGYVYADARRRGMPPWVWTLIAAFTPNLLGFLLYFACRRAIASPCPHCGQPIAAGQRFCPGCGQPASPPLASGGLLA